MPVAPINGTEIHYETHGSGFPLLYIHGGFGGLGAGTGRGETPGWVPKFAEHFQVILYDRRSSGRSGFPRTPHTMELLASDGRELLRHLGHDRAHVWGTSAGGFIAQEFGFRHPDAAATLVIHESAPKLSRDAELIAKLKERITLLEAKGEQAAYEARRESGAVGFDGVVLQRPQESEGDVRAREQRSATLRARLAQVPREERIAKYAAELRNYSAYTDWDATSRLSQLKVPALVVYGTADTVFPDIGWDRLVADMPNFSCYAVPGVDHGGTGGVPGTYERILDFLREHTPARAGGFARGAVSG